ncbi:calcium calmodulin-dependent kinase protein [Rutstroemia sp. NJR-2017a BBW]|nr:calcium calmodulin-dependent kinase protein [Rutstroemia sp. NJR-2017a BBW]
MLFVLHHLEVARKVLHRDIKPANILYTIEKGKYIFRLADFGLSKTYDDASTKSDLGTEFYKAPEVGNDVGQTPKMDIYSLYMTLLKIVDVANCRSLRGIHNSLALEEAQCGKHPELEKYREMSKTDPVERASAIDMLFKLLPEVYMASASAADVSALNTVYLAQEIDNDDQPSAGPTTGDPRTEGPTTEGPTTGDSTTWDLSTGDQPSENQTARDRITGDSITEDQPTEDRMAVDSTTEDQTSGDRTTGDPTAGDKGSNYTPHRKKRPREPNGENKTGKKAKTDNYPVPSSTQTETTKTERGEGVEPFIPEEMSRSLQSFSISPAKPVHPRQATEYGQVTEDSEEESER